VIRESCSVSPVKLHGADTGVEFAAPFERAGEVYAGDIAAGTFLDLLDQREAHRPVNGDHREARGRADFLLETGNRIQPVSVAHAAGMVLKYSEYNSGLFSPPHIPPAFSNYPTAHQNIR